MDKYNIVMPQEVKDIIKQIEAAGLEGFAVGGGGPGRSSVFLAEHRRIGI